MKVLITGASGFIGQHLLHEIANKGYHSYCVTRDKSRYISNEVQTWISWEDINTDFFKKNNIDVVVHLSTAYGRHDRISFIEHANVYLPLRLLELCAEFSVTFINTDSFFTKPEFNCGYMKPYVMTKVAFLSWAKYILSQNGNLKFVNMRLEHVYGAHDSSEKFVSFMMRELKVIGNVIKCTNGRQKRDFVYVKDVVAAYINIIEHLSLLKMGFSEYQVGYGKSIMLRDFIETLRSLMNADSVNILYGALESRADEIMDSKADISALRDFGWVAKYSVVDGIKDMIKNETN